MKSHEYSQFVESLAVSRGETLLAVLDALKDEIADARNGEWSIESRKCAIEIIDEKLYNTVKRFHERKHAERIDPLTGQI